MADRRAAQACRESLWFDYPDTANLSSKPPRLAGWSLCLGHTLPDWTVTDCFYEISQPEGGPRNCMRNRPVTMDRISDTRSRRDVRCHRSRSPKNSAVASSCVHRDFAIAVNSTHQGN